MKISSDELKLYNNIFKAFYELTKHSYRHLFLRATFYFILKKQLGVGEGLVIVT